MDTEELLQQEDPYDENQKQVFVQFSAFWKQYQKPLCLTADAVYILSTILSGFLVSLFAMTCIYYFCIPQAFGTVVPTQVKAISDWMFEDIPPFLGRLCLLSVFLRWLCVFLCKRIPVIFPRSKLLLNAQPLFYTLLCLLSPCVAIGLNEKSSYSVYMESSWERIVFLGQVMLCILAMCTILVLVHRKSPKKKQCLLAGALAVAVYAGCFLTYAFDLTGRVNYVPNADEIASASFYDTVFTEPDNVAACTAIHREILEAKGSSLPDKFNLIYTLKNGKIITRHYDPTETNTANALQQLEDSTKLLNSLEGLRSRNLIPEELIGTDDWDSTAFLRFQYADERGNRNDTEPLWRDELEEFYLNCVVPDVLDGKAGEIRLSDSDEEYNQRNSNVRLDFYVRDTNNSWNHRMIIFRMDADRCLEWIQKHIYSQYPIQTLSEYYADYNKLEDTKK